MSVITEYPDRWVVRMEDAAVSLCSFDWAVSWLITTVAGDVVIRVAEPFLFGVGDLVRLDPDGDPRQLAPVLATVRDSVVRVEASVGGRLEIEFGAGAVAIVDSSELYEAWTVTGPGGAMLVASPGGGVVVWGSQIG
jgi:hypothetical protein